MAFHLHLIKPLLLLYMLFVSSYALSDPEILLKFKSSLTNVSSLENWENNSMPPCNGHRANWAGVLCYNGNIWGLQLESMGLSGTIDVNTLTGLSNLRTLSFMNNSFNGPIPELNKLNALKSIYLSKNNFSGDIPGNAFAGMIWLKKLHLSQNLFTGAIPASLATLPKLLVLKLDGNRFSGQIPDFKQNGLQKVDLSNNELEGSIPASLNRMNASMFSGNKGLCGVPLKTCDSSAAPNSNSKEPSIWIIVVLFIFGVFILLAILAVILINHRRGRQPTLSVEAPASNLGTKAGFKEEEHASPGFSQQLGNGKKAETVKLSFVRDDRERFDLPDLLKASAEILGSGSFGSSYKAALSGGPVMVVKRYKEMNNFGKEEFQEHMKRIGRLRHNNLLPLVAYYYRKEEKLLVTDFVKKGSLAVHLHGHQSLGQPVLDWPTRLKIVKGVAKGLAYLYKELPSLIAPHGHLKSSNVLLNESFEPLLTDYGLIPVINQESAQELMVAYKSPEYVQHGRITKKTDVWGLGVLILEILTGKFPANFLQKGKGSDQDDLAIWVKSVVGDQEMMSTDVEVFDKDMGATRNSTDGESMLQLLKIGLSCCEVDVEKRLDLKDAVERIEELKLKGGIDDDFYSLVAIEEDKK
ncbi:pollen receptor-like kinase 1 [Durio zibethinus]|uniref:non-specific serine/threonine protein kinase n=1 Tax=Durio zibethinus TaxID=66656 RepID=A0A6P5ZMB3_DURZI|nr:pollen receptor-like kinase 1 [Durio zibethinus]